MGRTAGFPLGRGGIAVAALATATLVAASVTAASRAASRGSVVANAPVAANPPTSTSSSTSSSSSSSSTTTVGAAAPAPPPWMRTSHPLTFGGIVRRYLLIRPPTTGARLPVVVVLHGRDATPELEAARTGFTGVTGPAVLVYPAGYNLSWDAGACCGPAQAAGLDDVGFVTAVLRDVQAANPDTSGGPVFLVGYSNGGKLAYQIACAEPRLFTAVAAVGAVAVASCAQPAPVAFVEAAYAGDPELSFGAAPPKQVNGYTELNVDAQVSQRARANGCTQTTATMEGSLTLTTWTGCLPGRPGELAVYQGVSHAWPAGDASTPSAQAVIWRFFRELAPQ